MNRGCAGVGGDVLAGGREVGAGTAAGVVDLVIGVAGAEVRQVFSRDRPPIHNKFGG